MAIESLNWIKLPEGSGTVRDRCLPPESRRADFDEKYDFRTLVYDAIYLPGEKWICLICPKLYNLASVLRRATFRVGGERLAPRLVHQGRFDEIWLEGTAAAGTLKVRSDALESELRLSLQDRETFRGLRCAVLRSKDNELQWIRDWIDYHVTVHGLQGVVIFDNASGAYSLDDLADTLASISGLEQARILSAPFPFGPIASGPDPHAAKFLAPGLTNIARLRYFQPASAVLVVDVDELVAPLAQGSVFASAESSPRGYVSFRGSWRYPRSTKVLPVRHLDHVYRSRWPLHRRPGGAIRATKYCICPAGPLGSCRWGLHSVVADSATKVRLEPDPTTEQIEYWHCRRITTDWKYPRPLLKSFRLKLDRKTKRVLETVFASGRDTQPAPRSMT